MKKLNPLRAKKAEIVRQNVGWDEDESIRPNRGRRGNPSMMDHSVTLLKRTHVQKKTESSRNEESKSTEK